MNKFKKSPKPYYGMKKRKVQRIIIGTSWVFSRAISVYFGVRELERNFMDEGHNKYMVKAYCKGIKARLLSKKDTRKENETKTCSN